MNALSAIVYQKVELKLQVATAKTCQDKKENFAKIIAICTSTTPAGLIQTRENKEVLIGEISPIIFFVAGYYPSLPKAKIAQIYNNRFKLENLYKFRYLKGCKDKNRDENIIFEHN